MCWLRNRGLTVFAPSNLFSVERCIGISDMKCVEISINHSDFLCKTAAFYAIYARVYSSESLSAVEQIIEWKKARILVHTKNTSFEKGQKIKWTKSVFCSYAKLILWIIECTKNSDGYPQRCGFKGMQSNYFKIRLFFIKNGNTFVTIVFFSRRP